MAAKRPSLAESMKAVQVKPTTSEKSAARASATSGYFAATREGKKRVTFPASGDDHRRLKRLAADTGRSIEALMTEAMHDLFEKFA